MSLGKFMETMQNIWAYRGPNQDTALKEYMSTLSRYNANWLEVFNVLKVHHKTTSWPTIGNIVSVAEKHLKPVDVKKTELPFNERRFLAEGEIFNTEIGREALRLGRGNDLNNYAIRHKKLPRRIDQLKKFKYDFTGLHNEFLQRLKNHEQQCYENEKMWANKYL